MWSKFWRNIAIVYVALALAPLVVVAIVFPIREGWRWIAGEDDWQTRGAVTSGDRAAELAKKGLIEQLITFPEGPVGLRKDPETRAFDLYAIGVSQTTLPEAIAPIQTFGIAQGPDSGFRYASSSPVVGKFNNIVMYEPKTGTVTKVFSQRVAISSFVFASGQDYEALIAFATDKDSDKDGKLTGYDAEDMYLFDLKGRALHKVEGLKASPIEITQIPGQPFVIVRAVVDFDRDGRTDTNVYDMSVLDQTRLFRVDMTTYASSPLLSAELIDQLQKTLDARAPQKAGSPQ